MPTSTGLSAMDVAVNSDRKQHSGYGWDAETVFDDARLHFDSMLAGIEQAQRSIELAVYIFELDQVGEAFVQSLRAAAQRGVQVKVLVDGVGSGRSARDIGDLLTGVGAEFHIYHPLPWDLNEYRWSLREGSWLEKFWAFINRMNRRDHRKFMVVDDRRAWCGNFNLCDDHLGVKQPWRDYGVCIEGAAVTSLRANFEQVWFERERQAILGDFQLCQSNVSLRMRWLRNKQLARTIRQAKSRVWICSAYFSPSRDIIRAIRAASKRGIDLCLIVAGRSDIAFFPLLTSTYYADLLKMGVQIYQYERGILHAKVLLADQQCIIGSTNLNHRSFYHDLELDVVLSRPQSIERIEQGLLEDMAGSHTVSTEDVSALSRSFWLGWLPRLLRYWV